MTRRRALVLVVASLASALTVVGPLSVPRAPAAAAAAATASFRSITPRRVVDTRHAIGTTRLGAGATATVDVVTPEIAAASGPVK
jgi:hypothetical protein